MKFYVYVLPVLFFAPQSGAQSGPLTYRIDTVAGSGRNGDGGLATAAQISRIQGIATDRSGNLYLSDTDNHRVRKVAPSGIITTVAGNGLAGYGGDGGQATQAQLNLPYGLAVDAAGNLYIADLGNNRVRRVWLDGVITTVTPETPLSTPRNVAVDPAGNLYIAEFDGHRVRRVSPDGKVTTVAGTGQAGFSGDGGPPEQAQLSHPAGLALDRGGALLIADSGNNRVRRIFSNGVINTVLGGSSGTALFTPVALATDAQGNIYAADTAPAVRAYSVNGRWSDIAGGATAGYSGDGGPAIRATLSTVRDLAVDTAQNIYMADGLRVRRIDVLGLIVTVAGDGYAHGMGDGGPASGAMLVRPSAVALDSVGRLTIADAGTQRVRQVTAGGIASTLATLNTPTGVAVDAAGTVYVADAGEGTVRAIASDRTSRTVAGSLKSPRGVCLSRTGMLYVSDTGSGRLLRVGKTVEIVASQLNAPEACALDSFGNLYLAETGAHRVRRLSPGSEWIIVAGTGEAGSTGDEGPAASARLTFPRGVAVDDSGNLYIADTGGNRIRLVTPDGVIHTIAGLGNVGFSGDGGEARSANLNGPAGLTLDGAGAIYFADTLNDRIRRLVPDALADPVIAPVSVVNALSGAGGSVAPGEVVRISGGGFGGEIPAEVWFAGRTALLLSSSPGQLIAQVPEDLVESTITHLEVRVAGRVQGAADLAVAPSAPGLWVLAVNQDGCFNTETQPAVSGSVLTLYATGQGRLESARPVLPVRITIGGIDAEVVVAQAAAGSTGLVQLAVRVPGGFIAKGEVPLVLTVGTAKAEPISVWLK